MGISEDSIATMEKEERKMAKKDDVEVIQLVQLIHLVVNGKADRVHADECQMGGLSPNTEVLVYRVKKGLVRVDIKA